MFLRTVVSKILVDVLLLRDPNCLGSYEEGDIEIADVNVLNVKIFSFWGIE